MMFEMYEVNTLKSPNGKMVKLGSWGDRSSGLRNVNTRLWRGGAVTWCWGSGARQAPRALWPTSLA